MKKTISFLLLLVPFYVVGCGSTEQSSGSSDIVQGGGVAAPDAGNKPEDNSAVDADVYGVVGSLNINKKDVPADCTGYENGFDLSYSLVSSNCPQALPSKISTAFFSCDGETVYNRIRGDNGFDSGLKPHFQGESGDQYTSYFTDDDTICNGYYQLNSDRRRIGVACYATNNLNAICNARYVQD